MQERELKLLWGRAGGCCSICQCSLTIASAPAQPGAILGDMAHIVGKSDTGPRGQTSPKPSDRNAYENLILLCPTHHRIVDQNPEEWPVERLQRIKNTHETWVQQQLKAGDLSWDRIQEALEAIKRSEYLAERKDFVRRSLRLASRLAATLSAFRCFPAQRELFWREWTPSFQELVTLTVEKPPFEREGFDVAFDKMVKVIVRCQVDLARLELTVYESGQPGQPTLDEATVTALVTPVDESSTEALEVLQCYLKVAQDELNL